MPKVSDEHKAAMRERIQQAALSCMLRQGFSNVSMSDIISEAGLSAGAVYLYYKNKEALLVDVAHMVMGERMSALASLEEGRPIVAPSVAIAALMAELPKYPMFPELIIEVWSEAGRPGALHDIAQSIFEEITLNIFGYLSSYFHDAKVVDSEEKAQVLAEQVVPSFLGLVQGYALQYSILGPEVGAKYVESSKLLLERFERP